MNQQIRETTVWLVQTDAGYVHCAFLSVKAAQKFCDMHPMYHVKECAVFKYQPEYDK